MKSRPAAVPLRKKHAERRAPAALSLVAHDTMGIAANDDTETALLAFDDGDVIADIVPVPPSITAEMRDALERMMNLRFNGDTDRLDRWLHADHRVLHGASPFQTLVAGDGAAVLRALLWNERVTRGHRVRTPVERQAMLRLLR